MSPNYPFKCKKCGKIKEKIMVLKEYTIPKCCGKDMQRIWGIAGLHGLPTTKG